VTQGFPARRTFPPYPRDASRGSAGGRESADMFAERHRRRRLARPDPSVADARRAGAVMGARAPPPAAATFCLYLNRRCNRAICAEAADDGVQSVRDTEYLRLVLTAREIQACMYGLPPLPTPGVHLRLLAHRARDVIDRTQRFQVRGSRIETYGGLRAATRLACVPTRNRNRARSRPRAAARPARPSGRR
jgi:hypothetical protein